MKALVGACLILIISISVGAQNTPSGYGWIERGKLEHRNGDAVFTCNHPDALIEAVRTIRQEYGWNVSVEMPMLFSNYDLVEAAGPKFRAAHPNGPPVRRVNGGRFTTAFPQDNDMAKPGPEENALEKVVDDYNASSNPGKFELRKLGDGMYDVVGVGGRDDNGKDVHLSPFLDTLISVPVQQRSIHDTVVLILSTAAKGVSKEAVLMMYPKRAFEKEITVGGENVTARSLLLQAFQAADRPMLWDMTYNADHQLFLFNVDIVAKNQVSRLGVRVPVGMDLQHK